MNQSLYDIDVRTINGENVSLGSFRGKALLIVNVASKCGFTPQYSGLQKLYEKYNEAGFEILAFPCNQFAKQEPGSIDEIKDFCELTYNVTFPLFDKIDVNGEEAHPLYKYLTEQASGIFSKAIKWNFTKFLVDSDGRVVKRFAPSTDPDHIEKELIKLLNTQKV